MCKAAIIGFAVTMAAVPQLAQASSASTYQPYYAYEAAPACMPDHKDYHMKREKKSCNSGMAATSYTPTHSYTTETYTPPVTSHTTYHEPAPTYTYSQPELSTVSTHTALPKPKGKYCYKGSQKRYDHKGRLIK